MEIFRQCQSAVEDGSFPAMPRRSENEGFPDMQKAVAWRRILESILYKSRRLCYNGKRQDGRVP